MRGAYGASGNQPRQSAIASYEDRADELLARRDEYIRQKIDTSLPEDGMGLLFIGLLHRVDEGLPEDISLSYLIHRLPFRRAADIREASKQEQT